MLSVLLLFFKDEASSTVPNATKANYMDREGRQTRKEKTTLVDASLNK